MWTLISHTLHLITTVLRLQSATASLPDVQPGRVTPMVIAAVLEATPRVPAPLLIALAWGESRFEQDAQPRCGVLQVNPPDLDRPPSDCQVWQGDLRLAVRAGVTEIETMLADPRVAGDLRRMLLYRACGNVAFHGGCTSSKYAWVDEAITRFHFLERAMKYEPST